ncbi:hypothetical protein HN51_023500 [Arachis hypogaea]|nr:Pentatricopeptide repeat-containing protein [Arachis hypogaea]
MMYYISARKLFAEMPQRNTVSWSCLISGYAQITMPLVVPFELAKTEGLNSGMDIHALISKSPFSSDMPMYDDAPRVTSWNSIAIGGDPTSCVVEFYDLWP